MSKPSKIPVVLSSVMTLGLTLLAIVAFVRRDAVAIVVFLAAAAIWTVNLGLSISTYRISRSLYAVETEIRDWGKS